MSVLPPEDIRVGPENDFDPASVHRTYTLTNQGASPLSWEARVTEPWLSVAGIESGDLAPGDSVDVSIDVDASATDTNEAGPAVARVEFVDRSNGSVADSRTVTVDSSFMVNDLNGWTVFTPSADTRTIYVSSSAGNDGNDGLSPSTPKRTLAAGIAQLRHGFPDWMLLQRGDVWNEGFDHWKKGGRSQNEPMLVSTYGSAIDRPHLRTGSSVGLRTSGGGGSPSSIDNLAIVGIHFEANTFTGIGNCVGAEMLLPSSHFLIEDCEFEHYSTNLVFMGFGSPQTDFRVRRSVIADAFHVAGTGNHSSGLYCDAVNGLLIEENVFDHNGWSETVPGAGANIFNHGIYIQPTCSEVVVRGNILSNSSSHGLQLRSGGTCVANLFLRNSISLLVGAGNSPNPNGVTADVRGNVFLDAKDIDAANPRGWGIVLANIASGRVSYNVMANNTNGTMPTVLTLDGDSTPSVGIRNLEIERNIVYNWSGTLQVEGSASQVSNVSLLDNTVQNLVSGDALIEHFAAASTGAFHSSGNRFFSQYSPSSAWTRIANVNHTLTHWMGQVGDTTSVAQEVPYVHPDRSVSSYNATQGGASSHDAFIAEAKKQSWMNWRPQYMAIRAARYVRMGFISPTP